LYSGFLGPLVSGFQILSLLIAYLIDSQKKHFERTPICSSGDFVEVTAAKAVVEALSPGRDSVAYSCCRIISENLWKLIVVVANKECGSLE
jgi:hypothetical protein